MFRYLASICFPLAYPEHSLAPPEPCSRSKDGRLRLAIKGKRNFCWQERKHGRRLVDSFFQRSRKSIASGRLSQALFEYSQDIAWPPLGTARQSHHSLPYENPFALRVRETSSRDGMGRELSWRSNQWNPSAAHFLPSVSSLSALLLAAVGSVQRKVANVFGERQQARLAIVARTFNQHSRIRKIVNF